MALFRRRRETGFVHEELPGLAQTAASAGLQPAGDPLFETRVCDVIRQVSRTLHGLPARPWRQHMGIPSMFFTDAYRGTVDGRTITVANVHTPTETMDPRVASHVRLTSLVAVEMPTMLMIQGVEPRGRESAFHGTELPTGNAEFDEAFRVVGVPDMAQGLVTSEMQRLLLARDDWTIAFHATTLLSIAHGAFEIAEDVPQRIAAVLAIIAAFPATIVPAKVDHSVDDLLARIDKLDSVDDAIAFLEQLQDGDRERLARSATPLARFANVRTPEEAMTLFMSLPETDRLQILAMFSNATNS